MQNPLEMWSLDYPFSMVDGVARRLIIDHLMIAPGQAVVVAGPSGVGKSTLFNLIVGLLRLNAASDTVMTVGGTVVQRRGEHLVPPWRRNIGYCVQGGCGLQHERTVFANVGFPLHAHNGFGGKDAVYQRVVEVARQFRLMGSDSENVCLDRIVSGLSGGERQRTALARAFAAPGRCLYLLDEPLDGLDPRLRDAVLTRLIDEAAAIRTSRADGAIVMISHKESDALAFADRLIVLGRDASGNTRVLADESPRRLYEEPMSLGMAELFGSPAINVLPHSAVAWLRDASNVGAAVHELAPFTPAVGLTISFRPEAATLHEERAAPPGDVVALDGTIRASRFGGATETHLVELCSAPAHIVTVVEPARDARQRRIGANVTILIPYGDMMVFDDTTGGRQEGGAFRAWSRAEGESIRR